MGVMGTVGFFKKECGSCARQIVLRDTTLVVDVTEGLFWFVKKNLLRNDSAMDKYGTSMVALGQFYRQFFKGLRDHNVRPIIVFDGSRMSEIKYGEVVSKSRFLRRSCQSALGRLERHNLTTLTSLPQLASNCVKEIINDFGYAADQLHQAHHEVYPYLEEQARKHNAPVITSHSDFIFSNVPAGFIWFENLAWPPPAPGEDWLCDVHSHESLLASMGLEPGRHSPALRCLSVLLREDFVRAHPSAVNRVLELGSTRFSLANGPGSRIFTARLTHVVRNWPKHLTSIESVRRALEERHTSDELLRDFDALVDSFTRTHRFHTSNLAETFASGHDRLGDLHDALVHRESTAEFLGSLKMTEFRRTNIQDIRTHRSTFSLIDRVKQYLIERFRLNQARLYDRERGRMEFRTLDAMNQGPLMQVALNREILFVLFHFNERRLQGLAQRLNRVYSIDEENSNRLALLLLLARFGLKLAPRDNFDNTDQQPRSGASSKHRSRSSHRSGSSGRKGRSDSGSSSSDSGSSSGRVTPEARRYTSRDMKRRFFTAILNSFIFHMGQFNQGDQSTQEVPADIRYARQTLEQVNNEQPRVFFGERNIEYYTCKHLVEVINSTLHSYKEINSLYNFPGPNVQVAKCYDAVLIYKILSANSKTLESKLLELKREIELELCDF